MKKINVLLVDDDLSVLDEWRQHFSNSRYKIFSATSGVEALSILDEIKEKNKKPILIVLLDVVMQGLNGIEVLERIKSEFPFSKVYIITGNVESEEIPNIAFETGKNSGDGFFQKMDLDFDILIDNIENGINEQKIQFSLIN